MSDSIAKGVGEQLGNLGKQIVTEVVKTPVKIMGIDETKGDGTGGGQTQSGQKTKTQTNTLNKSQQEEIDKQQQLANVRQSLQQFMQPQQQQEPSVHEQQLAEAEQKKDLLKKQQILIAKNNLPKMFSKPRPGSGSQKGQADMEAKINIKAQ